MELDQDTLGDISTLLPRKKPTQGRSRKTVDKILEATRYILRDEGHRALTTIRVAERSGVTVGSIYQYFPSKHAIIYELYTGWLNDVVARLDAVVANRKKHPTPEDVLAHAFLTFTADDDAESGITRELTLAMQAHPELLAVEAEHQDRIAKRIASLLGEMSNTVDDATLYSFAASVYRLSVALMDTVQDTPHEQRKMMLEWAQKTAASAVQNFIDMVSRNNNS
jgi:AcrR family transcriptional regulator